MISFFIFGETLILKQFVTEGLILGLSGVVLTIIFDRIPDYYFSYYTTPGGSLLNVHRTLKSCLFYVIILIIVVDFLIIGIIFSVSDENYYNALIAIITVATALLINSIPYFKILKHRIWDSSWVTITVFTVILIISVFILFKIL